MSFSPDGEWLAGGAADPASHKIYIWDIANDGQLASTLDGGREPLIHVHVRQSIAHADDQIYFYSGIRASHRSSQLRITATSSSGTAHRQNAGVHLQVVSRR